MKNLLGIFYCFILCFSQSLASQELVSEQVKTLYIYNFFKHIEWLDESQKQEFVLAVYNDDKFFQEISSYLKNKKVKSKRNRVSRGSTLLCSKQR